jgi:copper chaperone
MPLTLDVKAMHCDACARRVTKAVEKAAPGAKVAVDLEGGRVTIDGAADAGAVAAAITAAGYPASPRAAD